MIQDKPDQFLLGRSQKRILIFRLPGNCNAAIVLNRTFRRLFMRHFTALNASRLPFCLLPHPAPLFLLEGILNHFLTSGSDSCENDFLVNVEPGADALGIDRPLHLVRHQGHSVSYSVYKFGLFQRVVTRLPEDLVAPVVNEVLLIGSNEIPDLLESMLPGERVRVVPVRDQHHLHVHTFLQDEPDTPQGRVDSCSIPVIHNGQAYLLHCQGRSAGSHRIGDAELMHGQHIEVSLHEIALVLPGNLVLGEINPVQGTALVVYFRLRGIDILADVHRLVVTI